MKLKEIIIYLSIIAINIGAAFLLNFLFFRTNMTYFIMMFFCFMLISSLTISVISKKMGYNLDIFAYKIEDDKYHFLNSLFIGELFSVPIAMFVTLLL